LKFGFYFLLDEWECRLIDEQGRLAVRLWSANDEYKYKGDRVGRAPYSSQEFDGRISGKVPVRDSYNDYINPQAIEFIDMYDPDLIWFDGDWVVGADERNSRSIIAYYYNHAHDRKEVAVNDRAGLARSSLLPGVPGESPDATPHGDIGNYAAVSAPLVTTGRTQRMTSNRDSRFSRCSWMW
jgi:alpha-L-fucosidase